MEVLKVLSDEEGYAFTPLTLLLFIPIVILAISYGNIVSEANMLANIATGGDVTYTVSKDIIDNLKLASEQSGRNAIYLATRSVIDNHTHGDETPFFEEGKSKEFVKQKIVEGINNHLINTAAKLSEGTGRDVYINNKLLDENTKDSILESNVEIYQNDPFGFYISIKPNVPIKVVQEGQIYMGVIPNITTYVSIEGLEDPYVWIKAEERYSTMIYAYPYYSSKSDASGSIREQYFFNNGFNSSDSRLHYLWDCLNGTNNPSGITPQPYYFPDKQGLSFFDRLENRTLNNRYDNENARLSTFVLGRPLEENQNQFSNANFRSAIDSEYFNDKPGYKVVLSNGTWEDQVKDPLVSVFVLSKDALNRFGFKVDRYNDTKQEVLINV